MTNPQGTDGKMVAICLIPNCGNRAPAGEPFCASHRDGGQIKAPCGECYLHEGEVCDICGAVSVLYASFRR